MVFWHAERDLACVVHGDDFTLGGDDEDLDWIEKLMKEWYEVKVRARLGGDQRDDKSIDVLGRRIVWTSRGIEYEADPKHRTEIIKAFNLEAESKSLSVTGRAKDSEESDETELDREESARFRAIAAKLNYLAQDSPDLQFAAKEVCRHMAKPTVGAWASAKGLARYVLGRTRAVYVFEWQYQEPGARAETLHRQ